MRRSLREWLVLSAEGLTLWRRMTDGLNFRPGLTAGQMISHQTLPTPPEGKSEVSRENSAVDFSKVRTNGTQVRVSSVYIEP